MTLRVEVAVGHDADAEEAAQATSRLRRGLLDRDVDAAEVPRVGEPPPESRAADLAALGALMVNIAEPQLTGVSVKEQRRLTDEWLARHTGR